MIDARCYDEDYFLRGKQTGKSLYENYRWIPELTIPMAESIVRHLGILKGDCVLDFGCARGYVVKAFRLLGYDAWGVDVSEWAIDNVDPDVKQYCSLLSGSLTCADIDWVIAKDVLEHVEHVGGAISDIMRTAVKGVLAVVPLSSFDDGRYVVEEYEKDVTHAHRLTLETWENLFMRCGWDVDASYRVVGIKDNYFKPGWEEANGFITARRV